MLSFPQHVQGGRGFFCCLLLEETKKPNERGWLSEAEYSQYEVQPSEPWGIYTREAWPVLHPTGQLLELLSAPCLGAAYVLKLTVPWTDGCNNFVLCGCRCFYPPNFPGREGSAVSHFIARNWAVVWWGHTGSQQQRHSAIRHSSPSLSALPDLRARVRFVEKALALSDCEEREGAKKMGRVVPAPNTKTRLPESPQYTERWQLCSSAMFSSRADFLPVLIRLSVLVFQPPPALSGHRSMFTQAPQPEIWWALVHASVWLCWMHQNASSRVTSYIKYELWQGNQRVYNTTLRRVTALEARNPFKTLWILKTLYQEASS